MSTRPPRGVPVCDADHAGSDAGYHTPRLTPFLLRAGAEMCPRQLDLLLHGQRGTRAPFVRFRTRDAFLACTAAAHAAGDEPDPAAFQAPDELLAEERALFRLAADTYLDAFGDVPARLADLDRADAVRSQHRSVEIGGPRELALIDDTGMLSVRRLEFWGGPTCADPAADDGWWALVEIARIVDAQRRVAVAARHRHVRLHSLDVVDGTCATVEVALDADTVTALSQRLRDRVDMLFARAERSDARAGMGCSFCAFVPNCPGLG